MALDRATAVRRESEERFRLMADTAPVMMWMSGPDKLYTYFNKGWLEFTGRSMEHELGNGWADGVHSEDLGRCIETYHHAFDSGKPFRMEYRLRRFDGEYRWILDTGVPRFEPDRTFTGYIGSAIDITERKQVEQVLSSRLQFETLLSDLSATFISVPPEGVDHEIERWLQRLVEFLAVDRGTFFEFADDGQTLHRTHSYATPGITPLSKLVINEQFTWITEQLRQGKTVVWSRIPDDLPEEAKAERAYAMRVGAKSELNIPIVAGGRVICAISFTSLRCYRVWDAEVVPRLRLVGQIFANALGRKRAEEGLRLSEERYRALVIASAQIIWRTNAQGEALFVTSAWQELTGQRDAEMNGYEWLDAVHPDDRAPAMQVWEESVRDKRLCEVEFRVRMRDGGYRAFHVRAVPIMRADGGIREWVGAKMDITERKRADAALKELSGRLIHAQEEERRRIARELHDDVNQRLALLAIGLQQLDQRLSGSADNTRPHVQGMSKLLTEISSDVQRLSHQLHTSKLEHLGLVAALGGLCRELSKQHAIQIDFLHRHVPKSIPKDSALCLFRIAQEALRNMGKHSSARVVQLELSGTPDSLRLCLSDSGVGFDPASVGNKGGLGLISMQERVRGVGGDLSIESQPSRGTRITARVPLAQGPRQAEEA